MEPNEKGMRCSCPHHKMVPIFIILIGLVFLLGALGVLNDTFVAYAWPILIIVIGLQKLFGNACKCCDGHKCC